jgi:flagellin
MPLTINTNMAASRASYFLSKNNDALQKSLDRLSSGKKITQPADDAGGLAVSMKMKGNIDNLQDGILDSAAQIVSRMSELKGLSTDVLKSQSDRDTYDAEFSDLQDQLYQLSQSAFNGVDLFDKDGSTDMKNATQETKSVVISSDGSSTVDIHQSALLGALTIEYTFTGGGTVNATVDTPTTAAGLTWDDANTATHADGIETYAVNNAGPVTFALAVDTGTGGANLQLQDLTTEGFTLALSNVASLRATNGDQASRLQYAQESIATQAANMEAALGRILDVDIAAETTNLAKQQILVQASASMVAQANSANQVALMLLQ